jgi:DNA-nicking Smr family endonuclease
VTRRRQLSDEEHALWAGIARSIKPLRPARAATKPGTEAAQAKRPETHQEAPRKARSARQSPGRRDSPPAVESPPLVPLDRRTKQRVARGRDTIDARIDLHGMTQRQAHAALLGFLRQAQAESAKVVLVVTGKGGASQAPDRGERGVLRRQVPMWLELPEFRHLIVGFGEAHTSHGGQGALYLRLRRAR